MNTPSRKDLDAYVSASAALLGLTIDAAYRPSVIDNLGVILQHHALVSEQTLPLDIEPAFEFRP